MKTILLVDDSRAVRLAERRVLQDLDVEVVEANNGAEALEVVRSGRSVDAVLLDWNMPIMDGITFLRALRLEPLVRQPVVVMCTTESDMTHIVEAISAGANEYIMKPFTEEIVRSKLEQAGIL